MRPEYVLALLDRAKVLSGGPPPLGRETTYAGLVAALGVTLSPAQQALTGVAFGGRQPADFPAGTAVWGRVGIPAAARRVLVAVCGARSGKTYLGALRLLHLAMTVDLSHLARGEHGVALIVAPDMRLARQGLSYVAGALEHDQLAPWVTAQSREAITLRRPWDGRAVTVECLPATRGGSAVRGRSLVGGFLDEAAFFRDADYAVNDEELFKAISPRVVPGGQVIVASTAYARAGLLWSEFLAAHPTPHVAAPGEAGRGRPVRAMAAHAPTLLMRDGSPEIAAIVEAETARDPANAEREYGAVFMSSAAGAFFDAVACRSAIREDASPVGELVVGCDLGFARDSSAWVVLGRTTTGYRVLEVEELRPTAGAPLRPSDVLASLIECARRHGAREVATDQHYLETAREHLGDAGMTVRVTPPGAEGKSTMYALARQLLHDGRLVLPAHERLQAQLRQVTARPTAGGGLSIQQARTPTGGHGDIVSALVAACWAAPRDDYAAPVPEPDDPREADALRWQRRVEAQIERDDARDEADRWY